MCFTGIGSNWGEGVISGGLVLLLKEGLVLFEGQICRERSSKCHGAPYSRCLKNFSCKSRALGFSSGENHGKLIGEKIIEICRVQNLIGGRCRSLLAAEE